MRDRFRALSKHPQEIAFLTISGSHLYGFESADSDYDLRGAHVCTTDAMLSLDRLGYVQSTYSFEEPKAPGSEEIVTHEIGKFIGLMIKNGGNLLDQLVSPLVVVDSQILRNLRAMVPEVLSLRHVIHYQGFANDQVKMMNRRPDKETKLFLYIFRTLMSGIIAATEKTVEPNLAKLASRWGGRMEREVNDLIAWKKSSGEERALSRDFSPTVLWAMVRELESELESAIATSSLVPDTPHEVVLALNEMLLQIRLGRER